MILLQIFGLVIAVEAISEIITSSKLTEPIRGMLFKAAFGDGEPPEPSIKQSVQTFFYNLLDCGYCTSVWVAAFAAFFAPKLFAPSFFNWLLSVFIIHRLSNWLHVFYELIRKGRVWSFDVVTSDGET